jgi:hypothetical protein
MSAKVLKIPLNKCDICHLVNLISKDFCKKYATKNKCHKLLSLR